MNARKFIAVNSREALKLVRVEMGPDAVILSNRKVPEGVEIVAMGSMELTRLSESRPNESTLSEPKFAAKEVAPSVMKLQAQNQAAALGAKILDANTKREIAVAKTEAAPAPAKPAVQAAVPAADQSGILSEIKSMRTMLQEQLASLSWSDMQQRDPKRSALMRDMINVGFSPALSRQLLDKMPANGDSAWVRRILGHNIRVASPADDVVTRGGIYALVGPTGVGKTTTTAKLAARCVVRHGADSVALLTTDGYRIGAHEQLRIYGRILGVQVHAVRDAADLRRTLGDLSGKHMVLIDTIGMSQRDRLVAEQASMLGGAGAVRRLLLLNATSRGDTLDDVIRAYAGEDLAGCILTKVDEAASLAPALDAAVRHGLLLSYVANGQRVPEDLHLPNRSYLLHRAFKQSAEASPHRLREEEIGLVMAGRGARQQGATLV